MADDEDLEYFRDAMFAMNDLRNESIPGDFSVNVRGEEIAAHKLVLAVSSPYFKAMITLDCKESRESRVDIEHLEFAIVKSVIDYLYTKKIDINDENVQSLLDAASFMQVHSLEEKCSKYLAGNIDISNCVDFLHIADELSLEWLAQQSTDYILENFAKLNKTQIVKLSLERIIDLFQSENLVVNSEYELFKASKLWACHNDREEHLLKLLKQIRFPQLSVQSFIKVALDPIIQSREECTKYIAMMRGFCFPPYDISNIEAVQNGRLLHARDCSPTCIYYFTPGKLTMRYNPSGENWTKTNMAIIPHAKFNLVAWNNVIYFIYHDFEMCHVACYNYHSNLFTPMPSPVLSGRQSVGLTTIKGCPFITGDEIPSQLFCPQTKQWIALPAPHINRGNYGIVSLDDKVYVIGGFSRGRNLSSVERFERGNGWSYWEEVSPMLEARSFFGCTTFKGHIYVVGGKQGLNVLASGEKYDPREDKWEPIAPMLTGKSNLSLVVLGDKIFAISEERRHCLEAYNPVENRWARMRTGIPHDVSGIAVAIKG